MEQALEKITVLFVLILASSLLIERFIEFVKTIIDLLDSRYDWHNYWTSKTLKMRDKIERKMRVFEYVESKKMAGVLERFRHIMVGVPSERITSAPILAGDMVRAMYIKIYCKFFAMLLGVGIAFWFQLDLLGLWKLADMNELDHYPTFIEGLDPIRRAGGFIATGLTIGLGSGPVHKIINQIEKRRPQTKQMKQS